MRNLYRLIVLKIERSLSKMKSRKQKKSITFEQEKKGSHTNHDISSNESTFHSVEPKNTSTPMNFIIYSLYKGKNNYIQNTLPQDFKIYEEFDEYEFLSDYSSGSNSGNLSGIKIYEDFEQFCEESENEEKSIFENVVNLNSLEIDEKEVNNSYEIVTVTNSETKLESRFRPRTLKTGVVNYRPYL